MGMNTLQFSTFQASDLSQSLVDQYRKDGFIQLEGVFQGDELKLIRDSVANAVASETVAPPDNKGAAGVYEQIFIQKVNLWRRHTAVRKFVLSKRLGNIAARLESSAEPAASASRGWCATRSATSSPTRSRISASRALKTLRARCAPTR